MVAQTPRNYKKGLSLHFRKKFSTSNRSHKEINENFLGPYNEAHFNGKEAEVIVYVSSDEEHLLLQSMARARRLTLS